MDILEGDRVVLIQPIKNGIKNLKENTVCTCCKYISDDTILVQYDFTNDKPQFIGVPVAFVRLATQSEINKIINYKKLVAPIFHVGNHYIIENQNWKLSNIKLAVKQKDDEITLTNNKEYKIINRELLEKIGSYDPIEFTQEEATIDTKENQNEENSGVPENDIIKITINDCEFVIANDMLIVQKFKLNTIDDLIINLNKLKKLLKGCD